MLRYGLALVLSLATGCVAQMEEEDLESNPEELLGIGFNDHRFNNCSPDETRFLWEVMRQGRIVAMSDAFEMCLDHAMQTEYLGCIGDPGLTESHERRMSRLMGAVRSPNFVTADCDGITDPDSEIGAFVTEADSLSPGDTWNNESYHWSERALTTYMSRAGLPLCNVNGTYDARVCRYPGEPHFRPAGTIWHEAMHLRGYEHGSGTDVATWATECGFGNDPSWNHYRTVPHIVGDCMAAVMSLSVRACGDGAAGECGESGRLVMVGDPSEVETDADPVNFSCECIEDPSPQLAITNHEDGLVALKASTQDVISNQRVYHRLTYTNVGLDPLYVQINRGQGPIPGIPCSVWNVRARPLFEELDPGESSNVLIECSTQGGAGLQIGALRFLAENRRRLLADVNREIEIQLSIPAVELVPSDKWEELLRNVEAAESEETPYDDLKF